MNDTTVDSCSLVTETEVEIADGGGEAPASVLEAAAVQTSMVYLYETFLPIQGDLIYTLMSRFLRIPNTPTF